jgi:sugar/nucleoside kinase (ribokinase family)
LEYLSSIPKLELGTGIEVTSGPNPRVELRYQDRDRRSERPSGGVPPWVWEDLGPVLQGLDALYLNFITGQEMSLETAVLFRERFPGPLYADLHTLFTGISSSGKRFPRQLPDWEIWFRAFDAVQMNEDEFRLAAASGSDPWEGAADFLGRELKLIAVTMGPRGAAYLAAPGFQPDPVAWPGTRGTPGVVGNPHSGRVPAPDDDFSGDPTGCGDVWGATFFGRLLGGDSLEDAMLRANRLAAANVEHHGARGLHLHLLATLRR